MSIKEQVKEKINEIRTETQRYGNTRYRVADTMDRILDANACRDASDLTTAEVQKWKEKLEIKPTKIELFSSNMTSNLFSPFEKDGDKYKFRPVQADDGIAINYISPDNQNSSIKFALDYSKVLKFPIDPSSDTTPKYDGSEWYIPTLITGKAPYKFTSEEVVNTALAVKKAEDGDARDKQGLTLTGKSLINTAGHPFGISGLINAEHDQTFVNEVLLRADGTMGIIPKRNFLNLSMQNTNITVNHVVPRDIKTTQFGEKVKEYLLNYGSQPFTPFRKADYEEIQTLGGLHKDKCSVSEDGLLHLVVNNDDFKTAPGYDTNTDLLTLQGKKILPHDKDWMVKIDVIDASASVLKNVVGIGNTDLNPVAGVEYNNFSQAGHFGYTPIAYMTWNTYTRQKSFSVFIIKTDAILNILIYAADILYYHIVSSEPSFGNYFPIIKLKKPVNIHNEKNSNIKLKISYKIIP